MAFDINLLINQSEPERLTKSLVPLLTVSGTLKSETSILNPTIIIACDLAAITDCNYMTIPVFKRSYYITDMRSIRTGLVEFTGRVDVLGTYDSYIRSNSAIVRRQENDWNLYLNDGSFKVYQNPLVLTRPFPSGFATQEFVLAVAGK